MATRHLSGSGRLHRFERGPKGTAAQSTVNVTDFKFVVTAIVVSVRFRSTC
jgi:hypothetical protein